MPDTKLETIVLGGGCFWCLEAVYQRVKGVEKVLSGYAGGKQPNPNYHNHGDHAEAVEVTFNPAIISLDKIMEVFWYMHDPTTINRQGPDVGTNYRSIALYQDEVQRKIIEKSKEKVGQPLWSNPIVTEIKKLDAFYPAEDYHQDFYNNNQQIGYCQVIINPKLAKFENHFADIMQ